MTWSKVLLTIVACVAYVALLFWVYQSIEADKALSFLGVLWIVGRINKVVAWCWQRWQKHVQRERAYQVWAAALRKARCPHER